MFKMIAVASFSLSLGLYVVIKLTLVKTKSSMFVLQVGMILVIRYIISRNTHIFERARMTVAALSISLSTIVLIYD